MATDPHLTEWTRPSPRLYLMVPPATDIAAIAPDLVDALSAGDVAAALVRPSTALARDFVARLAGPVQNRGVALLIEEDPTLVASIGADGVHVNDMTALPAALSLKPNGIVGAGRLTTRDEAMRAGEAGVDYVMFGEPDGDGRRPSLSAIVERVAWWAELFVVPCVAYAASFDEIGPLSEAGSDFVVVADLVFSDPRGARAALGDVASRLCSREVVA
jgi:thiamine-phosphate pyrophosphorylase